MALPAITQRTAAFRVHNLRCTARDWRLGDAGADAWEPSGDAFLSPTLVEAECLRRVAPSANFRA
ncbi:DUF2891 family protein [Phenylobacterium haematophilum]|uniref:DUF2891 family protein n=1 Tax=Phenylobacterium haematophilum TaxID=98513 RepID=UPI001C84A991|nr:DUF2891 family protein [Phenylobacterium haematophilum]